MGGEIPVGARFCPWCGTAVEPTGGHTRKTVTVVFSDLVGFTPLGEALEPEALREVMQRFYDLAARAVGAHGGRVASFAGDAVMAVFGSRRSTKTTRSAPSAPRSSSARASTR